MEVGQPKTVRSDMQASAMDTAIPPEGPYEVEGEPPVDWGAGFETLRIIEFVSGLTAEMRTALPVSSGQRELPIILELVCNHFTGRLTTMATLTAASGLSYGTAVRAIEEMLASGLIVKRPRTGTGKSFSLHPSTELLRRFQLFARAARRLGEAAFRSKTPAGRRQRTGPAATDAIIPPPTVLEQKLDLSRGLRMLVHADPTFMVMNALKRQFEMILGVPIRSKALSIDRLRREIVLNSERKVSQYDIVAVDLPWFGDMVSRNRLMPLDQLMQMSNLDVGDFIPDAILSSQRGGRQYGIPVVTTAEFLVYRSDLLTAAGLSPPRTVSETLAAARRLHDPERGVAGLAWNGGRGTALGHTFMTVMAAHGQPIVDLPRASLGFDVEWAASEPLRPMFLSPEAEAAAEFLHELLEVSPPGILSMNWYDRARCFASGGAAMAYSHSLLAHLFELDEASPAYRRTGYLPHPVAMTGRPVSPLGGYALAIPANIMAERIPAVWTALMMLTSANAAKLYVTNGSLASPRFSVSRDPEVAAMSPMVAAVDELARTKVLRMWPRPPVPGISAIIGIAGEEIHDMLQGLKSTQSALSDAQQRAYAAIQAHGDD